MKQKYQSITSTLEKKNEQKKRSLKMAQQWEIYTCAHSGIKWKAPNALKDIIYMQRICYRTIQTLFMLPQSLSSFTISLCWFRGPCLLDSSITFGSYIFSDFFSLGFPEVWGKEFYRDILFWTECSKAYHSLCIIWLCVSIFFQTVTWASFSDGWTRHLPMNSAEYH